MGRHGWSRLAPAGPRWPSWWPGWPQTATCLGQGKPPQLPNQCLHNAAATASSSAVLPVRDLGSDFYRSGVTQWQAVSCNGDDEKTKSRRRAKGSLKHHVGWERRILRWLALARSTLSSCSAESSSHLLTAAFLQHHLLLLSPGYYTACSVS